MKNMTLLVLLLTPAFLQAQIRLDRLASAAVNGVRAATFSDAEAAALSSRAVAQMDSAAVIPPPTDSHAVRLNRLFSKHASESGLKLNYKVYKNPEINAFATADGSIRVFSGLLDRFTDGEILAVIGHEVGHVANKDTRDAIRAAYRRAAITEAASAKSDAIASITQSQLGQIGEALLTAQYSRKQESEADLFSYDFMRRNGYKVMDAWSAFNKLAIMADSSGRGNGGGLARMFSSHPDARQRAIAIMERAKADGLWIENYVSVNPKPPAPKVTPAPKKTTPARRTTTKRRR